MTIDIMTVIIMTVSIMTVSIMAISIMTLSIMTLSIMTFSITKNVTHNITNDTHLNNIYPNDFQHNGTQNMRHSAFTYVKMQSVIFFNVMLNVIQSNVMAPSLELKSRPFLFRKRYHTITRAFTIKLSTAVIQNTWLY
jgi:hypothetical protein